MTRLKRWLRRQLERLLGVWHEGPEPPRRLLEEARLFRHIYPDATHDQWEDFACRLASNAYRDAFVRGFEWNERCWPETTIDGHQVAIVHQHDVSLGDGNLRVARMLATVPRSMSPEQKKLIRELAESPYRVRIEFAQEDE